MPATPSINPRSSTRSASLRPGSLQRSRHRRRKPAGGNAYKTVLLEAVEARRWALTYGFGFEARPASPVQLRRHHRQRRKMQSPGKNRRQPSYHRRHHTQRPLRPRAIRIRPGHLRTPRTKLDLLYQIPHFIAIMTSRSPGRAAMQTASTSPLRRLQARTGTAS